MKNNTPAPPASVTEPPVLLLNDTPVKTHTEVRREEALLKAGALQNAIFNSANFSSIATDAKGVIQNIRIVDDTPANVLLLARMLTVRGYRTRSAHSGVLALETARAEAPDLILLDIAMPEMDGYQVCKRFKADAVLKDIPVIFISALHETLDKVKAFRVGGVDYVTKPFQFEEVYARVETHLRMSFLQRQLSVYNGNLEQQVAERTHELAQASEQLRELGRLKDDFLHMISHEIRTPANGILCIGNLVLDMCPDSEERTQFAPMFEQSCSRLLNLIEDATLLTDMTQITLDKGMARSFPELLAEVRASLPAIRISIDSSITLRALFLKGSHLLQKKSLETVILLATSFSRDKQAVHLTCEVGERTLRVRLELDDLSLSADQTAAFFNIESNVRSVSTAEDLGLAPVVARQIIAAFGGGLKLVKGAGDAGCLEALFSRELNPVPPRCHA